MDRKILILSSNMKRRLNFNAEEFRICWFERIFLLEPRSSKCITHKPWTWNHSPGGYVRQSLKTLYFLLSFGQLCDIFQAFVDVPMHQTHFYVFEKNEISTKNERKTSRNQYVWAFIFEWSMFTVMHSGKTSEIEKCSPGVHVRRESKKSCFFSNRGRFRKISICYGENTLNGDIIIFSFWRFFLENVFSCKAIYEY